MMKELSEYTKEELKKGVRNPFYHKLCKDVTVGVNNEDFILFEKMAKAYDITPERVMQSALYKYAKWMREDDGFMRAIELEEQNKKSEN